MDDFKNSVANLDVEASVVISYTSVPGDNFYHFLYVSLKTGITPTLLTKDTYVDVLTGLLDDEDHLELAKKNLASLFEYASNARGYIISAADYSANKYKGYFVYAETKYRANEGDIYTAVTPEAGDNPSEKGWYERDASTGNYTLSEDTSVDDTKTYYAKSTGIVSYSLTDACKESLDALEEHWDADYSQLLLDVAIPYTTTVKDDKFTALVAVLNAYSFKAYIAARGAEANLDWKGGNIGIGYSPILYQLGRTLYEINSTGTPVGNSIDTVGVTFQDVILTRSTSTEELINPSAIVIDWLKGMKIAFFKTTGNSTGQLSLWGGWTTKTSCVVADWIVAYTNHMNKIAVAELLAQMNFYKNPRAYQLILAEMDTIVGQFVTLGRIAGYANTAPAYSELPKSGGSKIVIPKAWTGVYQDDLRQVTISGNLTVEV